MSRNDSDIQRDINNTLHWDERVETSNIEVTIKKGRVTLSGSVNDYRAKRAAEEDAWIVPGVINVVNNLEVDLPIRNDTPTDEEIENRVNSILEWSNVISPERVSASVEKGWVSLRGDVDLFWQRVRAEELAGSVYGVKGITNNIIVSLHEPISDIVIRETIQSAYRSNSSIREEDIRVDVSNGVVTLNGVVNSWIEDKLAREIAYYTDGVVAVHDELSVRFPEYSLAHP